MPTRTYIPSDVAKMLDVHPNSVRQWAKAFAPFLSDGANPPHGVHRAYTPDDVAVIRHIADMSRAQNMPWPAIAAALAQMPPEDLRAPVVDMPQNAPDGPQRTESALAVVHSFDALPAAIVERLSPLLSAEFERGRELGRTESARRVPPEYVLLAVIVAMAAMVIASMVIMR